MLFKYQKCSNCETYYDPTLLKCPECHKNNELYQQRKLNDKIAFMHPIAQLGLFLAGFGYGGMFVSEFLFANIFQYLGDTLIFKTVVVSLAYLMMLLGLACIILSTRKKIFFDKYKNLVTYIYGLGYALTLFFVSMILGNFISIFHTVEANNNQSVAELIAKTYPLLAFFLFGFVGPICEELTYRVGLYSFLRRINKYVALIVSAIVFGLIHFDFDAKNIVNELWNLPSYIVSGVILALAYEHRGPACSMTAHVLYNIFAYIVMLVK